MKYKQEVNGSLYHQLPVTMATQQAKDLTVLCSEVSSGTADVSDQTVLKVTWSLSFASQVKYREDAKKEAGHNLFSRLPETAETLLAKQISEIQSEVRTLNAS